ncbi:EAL domain-containing protein [Cohnella suwonensis]|uniref:EAL domain-containing protein n=1 Tax=Cohnella suwonensis TaxID=696072 RepID=A0ABW0M154_9BACL
MNTSWFGLERSLERAAHHRSIGIIGIDLHERPSGLASASREDGGYGWPEWLDASMGRGDIWFGDEVGGHLWLYAAMPDGIADEEEGEPYLRGLARRVREAMIAEAGRGGGFGAGLGGATTASVNETPFQSRHRERGIGCALLRDWKTSEAKDIVYEGVQKAMVQIRDSRVDQQEWDLRLELDRLLAESSIRSVYQPIMRLVDGKTFGYEALTRCPEGSLFDGPLALFRYAEKSNRAFSLDRLAREKAIKHCPTLGSVQKIFINVTMGIMNDPHFVSGQTIRLLNERGLFPGQVVFELTERSSIDDFEAAKKILAHYRSQGYEIAIDDAGAGYSSLQSIVELSPDYIKIDRSLVRMADQDEMKKHMLRTFVRFAKKMNIRTVAEGIERPEELRLLRAMGFDYAQGYLIGRPSEYPTAMYPGAIPKV